jgi:hypothetical protein
MPPPRPIPGLVIAEVAHLLARDAGAAVEAAPVGTRFSRRSVADESDHRQWPVAAVGDVIPSSAFG